MMRRGLTIVEILAVLTVLSVLGAILLPAIGGVRGSARTTESLSQLRQMTFAAQRYTDRWNRFPMAVRYEPGDGAVRTLAWDWQQTATGETVPGPMWRFTDTPDEVLRCPAWRGADGAEGEPFSGYNYNTSYLGGEASYGTTGWDAIRWGLRPAAVRRPADAVIFGAGGWRGGTNKFMRAPGNREGLDPWTLHAGGQAFRYHGGRTVTAHLDGHVATSAQAQLPPEPDLMAAEQVMDHPRNGFLSSDDRAYDPR
ncbi:MAG: type II secretion system protein [Phycisphaerales bacterium]